MVRNSNLFHTDSAKAFCATASAQITGTPEIELNPQSTYIASQYACADYPYDLIYTVLAEDIYLGAVCAPPWVTNPASLAAWSTSAASQVSYATMQDFADPFDQITYIITPSNFTVPPSTGITGSSSTTASPLQTVQIPTTATVSSSSTSAAVKWAVPYIYIYSLLATGHFLLYANL
ncbi:hypothetical protein BGW36DRAFT_432602 [Talaromyces proteolyticus]|uniref:Uncharacterized protein n=1 Tax=Talaromyces proteolyticus TaxID=1131652 RepID=A0AAD4PVY3_9EURO|nr:uncharacterized protein BGW36DRAFT_432602 [Talaromyces proteolyticus]KAH8690820.1 hypothetical protein BGW36DRAFT_432602 [Talaromyces proteolyticus]